MFHIAYLTEIFTVKLSGSMLVHDRKYFVSHTCCELASKIAVMLIDDLKYGFYTFTRLNPT